MSGVKYAHHVCRRRAPRYAGKLRAQGALEPQLDKGNYFALIACTHFHGQVKLIPEAHETAMANKRLFEDLGFGEEGAEVVLVIHE